MFCEVHFLRWWQFDGENVHLTTKKKAAYAEKCTTYVKKRPVRLKKIPVAVELLMISFLYDKVLFERKGKQSLGNLSDYG